MKAALHHLTRDHMTAYNLGKLAQFLPDAFTTAQHSKDPSTKVGALILGPGYEIRSSGWNGAPRGCKADEDERYATRDEKLMWVVHAEANAIANAARVGTPLFGCALVVTHMPCMGCARLIAQVGIQVVLCPRDDVFAARWQEDVTRTIRLFNELGIEFVTIRE